MNGMPFFDQKIRHRKRILGKQLYVEYCAINLSRRDQCQRIANGSKPSDDYSASVAKASCASFARR